MKNKFIELNIVVQDDVSLYYTIEFININFILRLIRDFNTEIDLKPLPQTNIMLYNGSCLLAKESYETIKNLIISAQSK